MSKSVLGMVAVVVAAGLALAGCGKDPMGPVKASLQARNYPAARQALEQAVRESPKQEAPHFYLFVLNRFEMTQADPQKQGDLSSAMIREYDWIADRYGIAKQYSDMERSIASDNKARILYHEARKAIFGD